LFDVAVLVLRTPNNRLKDLIPLVPNILRALNNPQKGKALFIDL
jgi:hypothetical protein